MAPVQNSYWLCQLFLTRPGHFFLFHTGYGIFVRMIKALYGAVWTVLLLLTVTVSEAQTPSGTLARNPVSDVQDTAAARNGQPEQAAQPGDTTLRFFYGLHAGLPVDAPLSFRREIPFSAASKDHQFYLLAGLSLMLGFIRAGYTKYFTDLFRLFSKAKIHQKSIKEQLVQNRWASMFLNLFFFLSAGTFIFQMALYFRWVPEEIALWELWAGAIVLVAMIYSVKFFAILLAGWLFEFEDLAASYNFLVFLMNKTIGVWLLPASILIGFGWNGLSSFAMVTALCGIALLFFYRFVLAAPLIRQETGITTFHFFIYLCGFEIIPVLVLSKAVMTLIQ